MTIVVAFLCSDGVVVAADSMITLSVNNEPQVRNTGKKVAILDGPQVFAFSGSADLGARFRRAADDAHTKINLDADPLKYPLHLSHVMQNQFLSTGASGKVSPVLAYVHKDVPHCCIFVDTPPQPQLLDEDRFYGSLGSVTASAELFLRFLVGVFCPKGQPNVRKGVFLATWAIEYVIETAPSSVAGPIQVVTLERDDQNAFVARELPALMIERQQEAIESARMSLRAWYDSFLAGVAVGNVQSVELEEG